MIRDNELGHNAVILAVMGMNSINLVRGQTSYFFEIFLPWCCYPCFYLFDAYGEVVQDCNMGKRSLQ